MLNISTLDPNGIRGAAFYEKAMSTEADRQALTFTALYQEYVDFLQCGSKGVWGADCFDDVECLDGLYCDQTILK